MPSKAMVGIFGGNIVEDHLRRGVPKSILYHPTLPPYRPYIALLSQLEAPWHSSSPARLLEIFKHESKFLLVGSGDLLFILIWAYSRSSRQTVKLAGRTLVTPIQSAVISARSSIYYIP